MTVLPNGWVATTLGDLSEYVTSGSRDWSKYYATEGALFVRTQDINRNRICAYENIARVALPAKAEGKRTRLKQSDLLITITGANVGKCALVAHEPPEAYVSQSVALVRLRAAPLARYLQRQLIAPSTNEGKTWLEENAYGMGRPVLSLDDVRSVPIRLAPLAEQAKIVDRLDTLLARVDAARTRLDRIPTLLYRFRQSVLAAATSGELTEDWREGASPNWDLVVLSDVASDFSYGSAAKSAKVGTVPVLRMGNIQRGELDWEDLVFTSDKAEIAKYKLSPGDVLFNRTNSPELVGKTAVFNGGREAIYAGYLIRVRCLERLLPDFLRYCLGSPRGRDWCWQVKTDGVSQSNINATKLAAFDLSLPPLEEQAEIVRRVEALLALADKVQAQYDAAKVRFDKVTPALLAKAFRGELVPQDPNDEPAGRLLERLRSSQSGAERSARKGRKVKAEKR